MSDNVPGAVLGSSAELVDLAAGNRFSQTGALVGLTQGTIQYIAASGLSNAQAEAVVAGIRGSISQTQNTLDGRLRSQLSDCDQRFK